MTVPAPDFVILTGFLGTGKTTLLRDFLKRPDGGDTAVIVNEVGEIGLDGAILRESGSDAPIAMLANGCVCCKAGNDLAETIAMVLEAERPNAAGPLRQIVMETSGLSKPGPILRQIAFSPCRFPVTILATFDAERWAKTMAFDEAVAQWAAAHRIVITKTDTVSEARLAQLGAEITALNPLAEIVATRDRAIAVASTFARLPRVTPMPDFSAPPRTTAHPRVAPHLVRPRNLLAYDDLAAWLDNLAGMLGERLLRLKGLIRIAEFPQPVLVQSVGTMFSAPRPFNGACASEASFLVIIARDLERSELEAVSPFRLFDFDPPISSGSAVTILANC
jgi:G3E family GTPase